MTSFLFGNKKGEEHSFAVAAAAVRDLTGVTPPPKLVRGHFARVVASSWLLDFLTTKQCFCFTFCVSVCVFLLVLFLNKKKGNKGLHVAAAAL